MQLRVNGIDYMQRGDDMVSASEVIKMLVVLEDSGQGTARLDERTDRRVRPCEDRAKQ